jgi:hypothetical protein
MARSLFSWRQADAHERQNPSTMRSRPCVFASLPAAAVPFPEDLPSDLQAQIAATR